METQMTGLQQFLSTTPGTLCVMSRRLGAIEDQFGKMSKSIGNRSIEPAPQHDYNFLYIFISHYAFWIFMFVVDMYFRLVMDHSRKSITKVGAQTERPAWANTMVLELKESIRMIVELTHMLCRDLYTSLTILKNNFTLTEGDLREESVFLFFHTAKTTNYSREASIYVYTHSCAERPVSTYDFSKFQFEGRTINQIFTHYGWERMLSWTGPSYTYFVQELYSTLQDVDTDEDEWEVYIHGRPIRPSPDILSTYLCILRQVGAYSTVEPGTNLSAEEIFRLMTGEKQYLGLFDLPLFVFQTMRTEAQLMSKEGMSFKNMLTWIILDAGVEAIRHEPTSMQLGPINSVTCWRLIAWIGVTASCSCTTALGWSDPGCARDKAQNSTRSGDGH
ncbi:hypothetical protein CJ030_MR5G003572 [Morella rubra]|uniref:Uncharacterized protein n=1 Tax=Morella rubra TaxID=262757 RepID=A0A6A1VNL8_9ROSI|nr:hypothetical protein CJ030_MR5G003572 [Morella rubra]